MKKILVLLSLLLILTSSVALAAPKAFPSAEGFGKDATGGRGGKVVEVTSLSCTGPGTLYEALRQKGPRTIIFRVGGTIRCTGGTYLQIPRGSGDVTIAGETAPGDGILIRGARFRVQDSNVIIRHMRFRQDPATSTGTNDDAVTIDGTGGSPLTNIILDHISVSYGLDGNLDIRNTWGITVQNSIFSYNDKSNLINANSKDVSYLNNIFALVLERAVRANTIAHTDLTYEMINNYVYGVSWPGGPSEGLRVTVENNVCEDSKEYKSAGDNFVALIAPDPGNNEPNTIGTTYIYANGNDLGDAYLRVLHPNVPSKYVFSKPLYRSTYVPQSTTGLKNRLLAEVGAYHNLDQGLDSVDIEVLNHIKAKTGKIKYSGSFPTLSGGTPYTDSDHDGIADNWEHNINGQVGRADNNGDHDGDGYTNLEEFLHYMAKDEGSQTTTTTNTPPSTTQPPTTTSPPTTTGSYDFYITEVDVDTTIKQLSANDIIQTSTYSGLSIGVKAPSTADSVVFFLDGNLLNIENGLPYTTPAFEQWVSSGTHTLQTRFYSGPDGTGSLLGTKSISLQIQTPSTQPPTSSSNVLVSNLEILELGGDGFVVGYTTDVPTTGQVLYGTSGGLGKGTSVQTSLATEHQIQVSGLAAGTVYFYRVTGKDTNGNTYESQISLTRTYGTSSSGTTSTSSNTNTNTNTGSTTTSVDTSELKAFPTAEGFGRYATGGRGGRIVEVTSLACTGPGTLYDALRQTGKRIIIFKVGGTIQCTGGTYHDIPASSGDVTIAGETAPGDGILIRGSELRVSASNVIIRHIRFRHDASTSSGSNVDSINIKRYSSSPIKNIILDHISASWGVDESMSMTLAEDITLQNSIIAESHYGLLQIDARRSSIIRNLFAKNDQRSIRAQVKTPSNDVYFEMYNNIIYGMVNSATQPSFGERFNIVQNKYVEAKNINYVNNWAVSGTTAGEFYPENTYAYVKNNIVSSGMVETASNLNPYLKNSPLSPSDYNIQSIQQIENELLNTIGARPNNRDAVDTRIIKEYRDDSGVFARSGTHPTIRGGTAYVDTDHDGIADNWERNIGGQVGRDDSKGDHDGDGYTNVEEYLHYLAGEAHYE